MLKQIKRILGLVLSGSVLLTSFATPVLADESYAVEAAETSEELPAPYSDQNEAANGLPEYAPDENEIDKQYDEPEYLDGDAEETVSLASMLYYTYGPLTYTITSSNEITITDCDTSATSVDIPSEIDGIPVTSIGNSAFYFCSSLTNIIVPSSIMSIGNSAFYGCSSLTSIVIPGSVKEIGETAFGSCTSLKEVILEEGVETIGEQAFSGNYAYQACEVLERVSLPSSLKSIGRRAFYECSSLKEVHYAGTEDSWGRVSISSGNDPLLNATIYFGSIYVPPQTPESGNEDVSYSKNRFYPSAVRMGYPGFAWSVDKELPGTPASASASSQYKQELKAWANEFGYGDLFTDYNIERIISGDLKYCMPVVLASDGGNYKDESLTVAEQMRDLIFMSSLYNSVDDWRVNYLGYKFDNRRSQNELIDIYNRVPEIVEQYQNYENEVGHNPLFSTAGSASNFYSHSMASGLKAAKAINGNISDLIKAGNIYLFVDSLDGIELPGSIRSYESLLDLGGAATKFAGSVLDYVQLFTAEDKFMGYIDFCASALTGRLGVFSKAFDSAWELLRSGGKTNVFFAHYYLSQDPDYLNKYFDIDGSGNMQLSFYKVNANQDWREYAKDSKLQAAIEQTLQLSMSGLLAVGQEEQKTIIFYSSLMRSMEEFDSAALRRNMIEYLAGALSDSPNTYSTMLKIACPVDVELYDMDNNLAASVKGGEVSVTEGYNIGAYTMEEENDVKVLLLPSGADYRLKLLGTDSGDMDITLSELDENGGQVKQIKFEDVPLETDKVFETGITDAGEINSIDDIALTVVEDGVQSEEIKPDTLKIYEADQDGNINIPAEKINLSMQESELTIGKVNRVTAEVLPADHTDKIVWSSSDPEIISVDQYGAVLANYPGSATITAATEDGSVFAEIELTATATIERVSLSASRLYMSVGESQKIEGVAEYTDGSLGTVRFDSSDPEVVEVDADGNVTAVSEGEATIVATSENSLVRGYCEAYVSPYVETEASSVVLEPKEAAIKIYDVLDLNAALEPQGCSDTITWSSSDNSVAELFSGKVRGISEGSVVITATAGSGASDTAVINVVMPDEVSKAAEAIGQIPEIIGTDTKETIDGAAEEYDALSAQYQLLVGQDLKNKLDDAKKVLNAAQLISELPEAEAIALTDEDAVNEANRAYIMLYEDRQKLLDPELKSKLNAVLEQFNALKTEHDQEEQEKEDAAKAQEVTELINALPETVTIDDSQQIFYAKTAYDSLTDSQKSMVDDAAVERLNEKYDRLMELFNPSPTATPIPTQTPEPTETPAPTSTPEPTATATAAPTEAPTPTATATATAAPTEAPTASPTATAIPTQTPEPTATATPTSTAPPTATPDPILDWSVSGIENGAIIVTAPTDMPAGVENYLYVAKYTDDGILEDIEIFRFTTEAGRTEYVFEPNRVVENENVRIMLWDGAMRPLI